MSSPNVLDTRAGRLATFGMLYVAEGIPLGFTATAMAAYMRRDGLDVAQIGAFVAMLYVPWGVKWAWAPLVDLVKLERFGGRKIVYRGVDLNAWAEANRVEPGRGGLD